MINTKYHDKIMKKGFNLYYKYSSISHMFKFRPTPCITSLKKFRKNDIFYININSFDVRVPTTSLSIDYHLSKSHTLIDYLEKITNFKHECYLIYTFATGNSLLCEQAKHINMHVVQRKYFE